MSGHAPQIDNNNAAADAAQVFGLVALPFFIAVFVGLIALGGVPMFGFNGADVHHAEEAAH